MTSLTCPEGIAPEDAAAWAVDAEPVEGVDMAAHLPTCDACRAVAASVLPAHEVAARLRGAPDVAAAARAADRAVRRVRVESTGLALLRTLGGALGRVARAAPDYLAAPRPPSPDPEDDDGR